ncbi:DUF6087 family protein [Streptomyces sp. NPDC093094]|uniref:DUF6087 family protein n=1 Tax=Streptomyces sp. NPDC093094 TaxID=3366026 RepID=UPI003823627B
MDDEPLSHWAKRRDAKIGRLRAVPLASRASAGPQGAHLHPDAPRAIQRWNGHTWEPHGFAANYAEAQRILHPRPEEPEAAPAAQPQPLQAGRGRHRKPRPGE